MAIRLAMDFSHIPYNGLDGGANINAYSDYAPLFSSNGGTSWGLAQDSGYNWLSSRIAGQATYGFVGFIGFPVSRLWDITKARSYCGFRIKCLNYNTLTVLPPMYWHASTSLPGNGPDTNSYGIVKTTDFAWPSNQDVYVEVMMDWVNGQRTVWVDGVMVVRAQALGFTPAADHLISFPIASNGTTGNPVVMYKDFVFLDDMGDGAPDSTRLGPVVASPFTLADASGAGWVSSDNQPLVTDLNTPVTSTNLTSPYLTSPTDGTPLDMHIASTLGGGTQLKAVSILASPNRQSPAIASLKTVLADGAGNTLRLPDVTTPTVGQQTHKTVGYLGKALDGSTLTVSKLTALKMSMSAIQPGT